MYSGESSRLAGAKKKKKKSKKEKDKGDLADEVGADHPTYLLIAFVCVQLDPNLI